MTTREEVLNAAVSPRRLRESQAAAQRLDTFLARFGLTPTPESFGLYLTHFADAREEAVNSSPVGRTLRAEVALLDLHRRLCGEPPWTTDRGVQQLLRSLHRTWPRHGSAERADPLYPELLHALVDATQALTLADLRAQAAILLRALTPLSLAAIARLTWDDITFDRSSVTVRTRQRVGLGLETVATHQICARPRGTPCLVATVRQLRAADQSARRPFGDPSEATLKSHVRRWTLDLPAETHSATVSHRDATVRTALRRLMDSDPARARDRALLLLAFGAALRTVEASALRIGDIEVGPHGVVLRIPGRAHEAFIRRLPNPAYDPVAAWAHWSRLLAIRERGPEHPAFPQCSFSAVMSSPLQAAGLNYLVQQRASNAGIEGRFTFTSMRVGLLRSGARDQVAPHRLAAQSDLRSLGSVSRHERRENLLRLNVAAMLGL